MDPTSSCIKSLGIDKDFPEGLSKLLATNVVVGFSFKKTEDEKDKIIIYIPRECAKMEYTEDKGLTIWESTFMYFLKNGQPCNFQVHVMTK